MTYHEALSMFIGATVVLSLAILLPDESKFWFTFELKEPSDNTLFKVIGYVLATLGYALGFISIILHFRQIYMRTDK